MRNSPHMSIGLPSRKNKPYYPEVKKDFLGKSSPAPDKYNPNMQSVK